MALARNTAATFTELETDIRRELGDVATTPAGDTIPAGLLAFSSAEVFRAINNALIKLQNELGVTNPDEAVTATDFTYTEGAASAPGANLPAGVDNNQIFKVEDIGTADSIPNPVRNVSLQEIDQYSTDPLITASPHDQRYYYTLIERALVHGIMIRPTPPAGRSFRIWHLAAPVVGSAGADAPALANKFRELIGLETTLALSRNFRVLGRDFEARYTEARRLFHAYATRQKGPMRIRRVNRGLY